MQHLGALPPRGDEQPPRGELERGHNIGEQVQAFEGGDESALPAHDDRAEQTVGPARENPVVVVR
eukprot:6106089-Prorocentrum_lima.AAC.1